MPPNEIPFDIEEYYRQNFPPGMSEAKKNELLTALRTAKRRAPATFSLEARNRAEGSYYRTLNALFREMEKRTAGMTDPEEIVRALRFFADSPEFSRICEGAARSMATLLAAGQKADWRAAAAASSRGRRIYTRFERWNSKPYCKDSGQESYGAVEYPRPLTIQEMAVFGLSRRKG